jgi:hypothetical protein
MALNATIDLTVKKPDFKGLKAEIQELTKAAELAVYTFGQFSPEATAATKALAESKSTMQDFNDQVTAINPNRFAKIGTVISGVASGFATAQGAMALFDSESKDLEKTMVKLQGAMALSQGIEGLGKIRLQFTTLYADMITGAKKAFAAIKAGIGSTGIGLILVALGAIVAYWDDIKEAVTGVDGEQKKLLSDSKAQQKVEQDKLDILNGQDSILKLQGLTEEEILKLKIQQTSAVITQLEAQLTAQETMKQAQMDAAQRNQDILKGVIEFLTFPLTMLLKTIDNVGKALGQDFGLQDAFSGTLAKMVFDPKSVEKEANVAIAETKKQLNTLKNTNAGYQLSINAIHTKAAEDKKKIDDDAAEKEKERLKKFNDDIANAEASARDAERQKELAYLTDEGDRIQQEYSNKLAALEEAKAAELKTIGDNAKAKAAIEQKYNDLQIVATAEVDAAELALQKKNVDAALKIDEEAKAKQKVIDDKALEDKALHEQQIHDLVVDSLMSTIGTLTALNTQHDVLSEAAAKKSFERQKALGIAEALISTYFTAQKAYESQFKPADISSPVRGTIAAAIAIAQGLAKVAIIRNKNYTSKSAGAAPSGGGQMSGGGMPQMSAPNISSSLPSVSGFDTKVFVTEGDIRRTTDRVDTTRKVSVVK